MQKYVKGKIKLFSMVLTVCVISSLLLACGASTSSTEEVSSDNESDNGLKVGFVTGVAGLGDKSFNDMSHDGAKKAEEEFGIDLTVVEPGDLSAVTGVLRKLVQAGNELVIAVGFDMVEPITDVAEEYPDVDFAVIDAVVDAPNVQSIIFKEHEGSFLIGSLAAMMTETDKVGVIPANDVPFLNRFAVAYEQGVEYINDEVEVVTQYIGSDMDAFNNPGQMKTMALAMYANDIDIIYPIAGGSGTGLFEAVKETDKYAFGINTNQDDLVEGNILTSMVKDCEVAVYNAIISKVSGEFATGIQEYGLDNGGIRLTDMQYTKDIIGEENINKIEEIMLKIISEEIEVTDITASE